jgi:hypothetical protein
VHDSRALVRAVAVECVQLITEVPYTYLHQHRPAVTAALGKALDDKKRYIRLLAASVRSAWYVMKE